MPIRLSTDVIKERLKTIYNGEYELLEFDSLSKPAVVRHKPCGNKYRVAQLKNFLSEGKCQCRICNPIMYNTNKDKKPIQTFLKDFRNTLGDEYRYISGYKDTDSKVLTLHEVCGNLFRVTPHMLLGSKQTRCPYCHDRNIITEWNNLHLEAEYFKSEYLEKALEENSIQYYNGKILLSKEGWYSFDYYIPKFFLLIKFDRMDHFFSVEEMKKDYKMNKYLKDKIYNLIRVYETVTDEKLEKIIKCILNNEIEREFAEENNIYIKLSDEVYNKVYYFSKANLDYYNLYNKNLELILMD